MKTIFYVIFNLQISSNQIYETAPRATVVAGLTYMISSHALIKKSFSACKSCVSDFVKIKTISCLAYSLKF